ncbi:type III-A CRISPR-associated RAMP protein Csm4 [Oribacterium sp.]
MNHSIIRFNFSTPVHFGKSKLEDGEMCFSADILFSALFLEAMKEGKEKLLLEYVQEEKLLFTDAFPFSVKQEGSKGKKEYCYFLPKPMCPVERGEEEGREKEHSILKKAYKKLKYLSMDSLSDYLKGRLDPLEELKKQNFGSFFSQEMVRILEDEDNLPYRVEQFQFAEDAGLYCIFSTEDEDVEDFLVDLLESLSYIGIGGKRASGKGKFSITAGALGEEISEKIKLAGKGEEDSLASDSAGSLVKKAKESSYLLLSSAMAKAEEDLESILEDASYLLQKRSGFIYSESYAKEQRRKKDFFSFQAGSCFKKPFSGDIFDVSDGGNHPVYRYGKAVFMEI